MPAALRTGVRNPAGLGSGPINPAFEVPEWRTYRTDRGAGEAGCLSKDLSVRDGSHSGVPQGFDQNGLLLRWIVLK